MKAGRLETRGKTAVCNDIGLVSDSLDSCI